MRGLRLTDTEVERKRQKIFYPLHKLINERGKILMKQQWIAAYKMYFKSFIWVLLNSDSRKNLPVARQTVIEVVLKR